MAAVKALNEAYVLALVALVMGAGGITTIDAPRFVRFARIIKSEYLGLRRGAAFKSIRAHSGCRSAFRLRPLYRPGRTPLLGMYGHHGATSGVRDSIFEFDV
jgi:hypothetical protein